MKLRELADWLTGWLVAWRCLQTNQPVNQSTKQPISLFLGIKNLPMLFLILYL